MGVWMFLSISLAGCLNGLGQVMMRAGGRNAVPSDLLSVQGALSHPLWLGGLALGWFCGLFWAWLVTRVQLAIAIPLYLGTFFGAAGLGAHVWLGEHLSLRSVVGFVLVAGGITLIVRR